MTDPLAIPEELLLLVQNAIRRPRPPATSSLFAIRATPYTGGLGAYALSTIPAGTQVFAAEAPFVNVVYAPFKKEVCAFCFAYDRGRKMKYTEKSTLGKDNRGLAWFCSEECHGRWNLRNKDTGSIAHAQVSRGLLKKQKSRPNEIDGDKHLSPARVEAAWEEAEKTGIPKCAPVLQEDDDEDTVFFLLDGILARAQNPAGWETFLSLNPSLQPYDTAAPLQSHIRIFKYLLYHLPSNLRSLCTASTILALITRDHGNSFGIFEDELGRDGEMLGYGTWTDASFFNHSCDANLTKRRHGRAYTFAAKRDIPAGEELCINYIEDAMDESVEVRRKRLQVGWGFTCSCFRCMQEADSGAL